MKCEDSKKRAQYDFSKSKYIFTKFSGFDFNFFPDDNFIALLSQKNIGYKQIYLSCIVLEQDQWEHCYEKEMNQLLNQKFGESFFDSLRIVGKKQFILKAKDSVFAFEDCDQTSRNPKTKDYNEQFKLDDKDYFKNFEYPPNYIKRNHPDDKYSYTSTSFVLMKDGSTKDFTTESDFDNQKNKIFEKNFNKQVEKYARSIKWRPATIEGIPVNSYMEVTITYE